MDGGSRPGIVVVIAALAAATVCSVALGAGRGRVVGCADSVYGSLGQWRNAPRSVVAGPVGWPFLLPLPRARSSYGPHRGLAVFVKALLVVKPGRTATVRIPVSARSRIALYYGTTFQPRMQWRGANWFRVSDGAAAITFVACPRGPSAGWTQFAGGFLVRGPQCAAVEVRQSGSSRWLRRRIPFGKATCG